MTGTGLAVFLAAPLTLADVLRAKNLVHAGGGAVCWRCWWRSSTGCTSAPARLVDCRAPWRRCWRWCPCCSAAGNFLSLYFPVKFHANLKRRDKLPFAASMLGIAAAVVGCAPFAWALRLEARGGATPRAALEIFLCAALGWLAYRALLPRAISTLLARREQVLLAVTRE